MFREPVILPSGLSYEESALHEHLAKVRGRALPTLRSPGRPRLPGGARAPAARRPGRRPCYAPRAADCCARRNTGGWRLQGARAPGAATRAHSCAHALSASPWGDGPRNLQRGCAQSCAPSVTAEARRATQLQCAAQVGHWDPITKEPCQPGQVVRNVGLRAAAAQYLEEHPWAYGDIC